MFTGLRGFRGLGFAIWWAWSCRLISLDFVILLARVTLKPKSQPPRTPGNPLQAGSDVEDGNAVVRILRALALGFAQCWGSGFRVCGVQSPVMI